MPKQAFSGRSLAFNVACVPYHITDIAVDKAAVVLAVDGATAVADRSAHTPGKFDESPQHHPRPAGLAALTEVLDALPSYIAQRTVGPAGDQTRSR